MEQYVVRLDLLRLPTGINYQRALIIAEAIINICEVTKVWDEPKHGHRLFYVGIKPEDVPQAGVHWIVVD